MATYVTITDSQLDPDAPLTSQLGYQWRDNPLAIAQADGTVALSLLPTVLLGTLTTTSGSTQTLSGLVLTPYKFLRFTVSGVSSSSSGTQLRLASVGVGGSLGTSFESWTGAVMLDLSNGIATGLISVGTSSVIASGATGYSTATTSVSFNVVAGTFDAGSILVYGEK